MIKAVIFDCFGVLISDGLEIVCQKLEAENPGAREYVRETVGLANAGLIETEEYRQRVSGHLGISLDDWAALVSQGEVRNPETFDLVRSLRGSYKTALLSNIGKGSLAKRFSDTELTELFDVVVASAEVGMMKPDHAIYRHTAELLAADPSECVFLDDREAYVQAARQTGMQAIWFRNVTQAKADLRDILQNPEY